MSLARTTTEILELIKVVVRTSVMFVLPVFPRRVDELISLFCFFVYFDPMIDD